MRKNIKQDDNIIDNLDRCDYESKLYLDKLSFDNVVDVPIQESSSCNSPTPSVSTAAQLSWATQAVRKLTGNYQTIRDSALAYERAFRTALAAQIQPAFNDFVQQLPHNTLSEKQSLARLVNSELNRLGLAIECPKTHRAAILLADQGYDPKMGRFMLRVHMENGRRTSRSASTELPELHLIADDGTRQTAINWYKRINNSSSASRDR